MIKLDSIKNNFHKMSSVIDTIATIVISIAAIMVTSIVLIVFVSVIYRSNPVLGIVAGIVCSSIAWILARWGQLK